MASAARGRGESTGTRNSSRVTGRHRGRSRGLRLGRDSREEGEQAAALRARRWPAASRAPSVRSPTRRPARRCSATSEAARRTAASKPSPGCTPRVAQAHELLADALLLLVAHQQRAAPQAGAPVHAAERVARRVAPQARRLGALPGVAAVRLAALRRAGLAARAAAAGRAPGTRASRAGPPSRAPSRTARTGSAWRP